MARFDCELFGIVHYSQELSYDELYAVENDMIDQFQDVLERNQADHLDFWGAGDCLQFQCVLPAYDRETLHKIFDEAAAVLPNALTGRLLCFDKHLAELCIVRLTPGKWQESTEKLTSLLES